MSNLVSRTLDRIEDAFVDSIGTIISGILMLAFAFVALLGVSACIAVIVFIRWMLS